MTFAEWWAVADLYAFHPGVVARAAWDAAVRAERERCAKVAETQYRPAGAFDVPRVFGGAVESAVYYRDAELHQAGRDIAAAIREGE